MDKYFNLTVYFHFGNLNCVDGCHLAHTENTLCIYRRYVPGLRGVWRERVSLPSEPLHLFSEGSRA